MPVTADDLLSLCSAVHAGRLGLDETDPAPRVRTLALLAEHADRGLTGAALAYERRGDPRRIITGSRAAAETLAFAAELAVIGIDEDGYVQMTDAGHPVLAPSGDERAAHARFLDDVAGVSASLFALAGSLEEGVRSPREPERYAELVDEATAELQRSAASLPTVAAERESGMVWMTFCRMVLDEALRALESGDAALTVTFACLARLQQVLDPRRDRPRLVELAASMLDAPLG